MPTPPTHDRLVARLVADAHPVCPLWSPHTRLALWLCLQVVTLGIAVLCGLRRDLGDHLRQPLFLLELGTLAVSGAIAAALALQAAVPGRGSSRLMLAISGLLGAAAMVLVAFEPATTIRSAWVFLANGAQCVVCLLGFSTIPWTLLFLAVRRGAPLETSLAGAYAGAAAFLFAAASVRIACPIDEQLHLLTWHATPVAMGAALSAVAGARWLDRWHLPDAWGPRANEPVHREMR